MIQNPVFRGFNPDPCICRRGDDYYVAVSSFEWFPGLPVYHSRDLKHWQLLTHVLTDDNNPDLKTAFCQRYLGPKPDLVRRRKAVLCHLWRYEFNELPLF